MATDKVVYIFIDESGNYDFSNNGSEYMIYTAVSSLDPVAGIHKAEILRQRSFDDTTANTSQPC